MTSNPNLDSSVKKLHLKYIDLPKLALLKFEQEGTKKTYINTI